MATTLSGTGSRRRYLVDVKFVLLAITVGGRHKLNLHSESVALRPQFETWAVKVNTGRGSQNHRHHFACRRQTVATREV
jgi:hypothetical protein